MRLFVVVPGAKRSYTASSLAPGRATHPRKGKEGGRLRVMVKRGGTCLQAWQGLLLLSGRGSAGVGGTQNSL